MFSWILIIIGSAGLWAAVGLEIITGAEIYEIMMKAFPWVLGLGMFIHRLHKK